MTGEYSIDEDGELPWPDRHAGVLLHPTSLPGPFGVGDLGPEAHNFVDWLAAAGQSVWQVLPLSPPGLGDSPYSARSAFGGNPLLISLEKLAAEGLLEPHDLEDAPGGDGNRVPFAAVGGWKDGLLHRAFARFDAAGRGCEVDAFADENEEWLADWALYEALRGEDQRAWWDWPPGIARREAAAVERARERLRDEARFVAFSQMIFERQWMEVRRHANERGVRILGDIPIFVARDSADTWANTSLFKLDASGQLEVVAGVPPDAFSAAGQLRSPSCCGCGC